MSDRTIKLKPFPTAQSLPDLEILTTVSRQHKQLSIDYLLQGDLTQIILPSAKERPQRQDELWQTTCFEFFLAIFNSPQYWEFNLAPTGDWNIYRFAKYRRGMIAETSFNTLNFEIINNNNSAYEVATKVNLNDLIAGDTPLEIAITTVIEDVNHNLSYWAITHPGAEADFHRRDSFINI